MKSHDYVKSKIYGLTQICRIINIWRFKEYKIIFTNGCFDILHRGHLHLLNTIADMHGKLIIGLNSDQSIKKIKGSNRPIQDEETRAMLLASMYFVDAVILFDEETPLQLIRTLKPDILVKGGDYKAEDIVGADFVQSYNGKVEIVPYLKNNSTTLITEKILLNRK